MWRITEVASAPLHDERIFGATVPPSVNTPRLEFLKPVLLCIDDSEFLLQCYKCFFESFGFEVLTAHSGRKGLELALLSPSRVARLSNARNGRIAGCELRRRQPGTPIILLSGFADVPAHVLELVDGFVCKGDEAGQLLSAVAGLISMPKFFPPACESGLRQNLACRLFSASTEVKRTAIVLAKRPSWSKQSAATMVGIVAGHGAGC